MKNAGLDNDDIIIETNPKSKNETWIIIGGEKKWIRKCPKCNKPIYHKSSKSCYEAKRLNKSCRLCFINSIDTKGEKNGMWNPNLIRNNFKRNCPNCGKELKYSNRDNLHRAIKINAYCPNDCCISKRDYKKIYTQEVRQKMKIKAIARVKRLGINKGICPFYNPKACEYFDKLNEEKGWNLQHALNGGEIDFIGYSLDSYDKDKNIIVEYDEPNHYDRYGNLKNRDVIRMNNIIKHLNCKFYRYDEKRKILKIYD